MADKDVGMDVAICQFGDSSLKPSQASFSALFRTSITSVISGVVVDPTSVKVPVKFGDSRSNRSRDLRTTTTVYLLIRDET